MRAVLFLLRRTILSMRRSNGQFCPEMCGGQFCPYGVMMDNFVRKVDIFVWKCGMDNFVHRLIVWTVLSSFVNYRWTIISILFIILDNNVLALDNFVHLCVVWTILSDYKLHGQFCPGLVAWTVLSES